MNIYQKLAKARAELKAKGLKMTGRNLHRGYSYFELADILPAITEIEAEIGLVSLVEIRAEISTLTVVNTEKPEEYLQFTMPSAQVKLQGNHDIQNLGATQTYLRRYLYFAAYEIAETEQVDGAEQDEGKGDQDDKGGKVGNKEKTPREKLIAKLTELQKDINAYAKEKGLNPQTTDERYNELLNELEGKKNDV